jgi:hypothetical protein
MFAQLLRPFLVLSFFDDVLDIFFLLPNFDGSIFNFTSNFVYNLISHKFRKLLIF